MSPQCQQAIAEVGNGVAASLRGVDCLASDMTHAAFGRLFGSQGALLPALSILLTLFIAFFAFALITGRTQLSIRALTPRMVTLGLVVTLATSWIAYQTLVWNLAAGAPDQIASLLLGGQGSATQQFGDKIDIVFGAIQQVSGDAASQSGQQGQPAAAQQNISTFSPQGMMWMGATLLLLGTVGVLVTARIALAVLMALGPVFVVMALFPATRGLFAGWLRGLVMMAVTPLFAVLGGTLMLELAIPVINGLGAVPGKIDPRAAMAFFLIGAVHMALMVLVLKVGATMVGNWTVFGLGGSSRREDRDPAPAPSAAPPARIEQISAGSYVPSPAPQRRIAVAGTPAVAANDIAGSQASAAIAGHGRIQVIENGSPALLQASATRARGIGSRFRAPNNARLTRSPEKTQ